MPEPPKMSDAEIAELLEAANSSGTSKEKESSEQMADIMKKASETQKPETGTSNLSNSYIGIFGIENLEKKLEPFFVPFSNKKAKKIPKVDVISISDTHACWNDITLPAKSFIETVLKSKPETAPYFVLKGDYIHGLKARNEKGQPIGPAYKDRSLETLHLIFALRSVLGDRIIPLIGDHDLSVLFPSFIINKYGENQTEQFNSKLTPEELKFLQDNIKTFFRAAKTADGVIYVHASGAPMVESWEQLEELPFTEPSKDQFSWANNTIDGRLMMGKLERKSVDGKPVMINGRPALIKVISYEDNEKSLKAIGGRTFRTGHYGSGYFEFEKRGKRRIISGVNGFIDLGNQQIEVTTEGVGDEDVRDESEVNHHGKQFAHDPNQPNIFLYASLGKTSYKKFQLEDLEEAQVLATPAPVKEPSLIEKIITQAEIVTKRGGFDEELYGNLVANRGELEKYEQTVLEEMLRHFNGTKDSGLPKGILPPSYYLKSLPTQTHKIFHKSSSKK